MNDKVWGFVFDVDKCMQCHACETACKTWRDLEPGLRWRRVDSFFTGKYPRPRLLSISVSCLHCNEPPCVEACPENAIEKRISDGAVLVKTELCVGCRLCAEACPVGAPQFGADRKMQKCDICADYTEPGAMPPCVQVCPSGALTRRLMTYEEKSELDMTFLKLLRQF